MHFQLLVTGIAVSVRIYLQSSQMFSMIYDENNKVGQSNGAHSEKCAQKCMILLIPIKTRHFGRHPQFINKKKKKTIRANTFIIRVWFQQFPWFIGFIVRFH